MSEKSTSRVMAALEQDGLLLAADARLSSVASIVAGAPVRGSWWSHPKGRAIFAALSALARHPDVITVPLVAGKVTFVHRMLWPPLLAVATAEEPWQRKGLSPSARRLLEQLKKKKTLQASGEPVREIAGRLLARSEELHSEVGSHIKVLETWSRWAARVDVSALADVAAAKTILEQSCAALADSARRATLPWDQASRRRS